MDKDKARRNLGKKNRKMRKERNRGHGRETRCRKRRSMRLKFVRMVLTPRLNILAMLVVFRGRADKDLKGVCVEAADKGANVLSRFNNASRPR